MFRHKFQLKNQCLSLALALVMILGSVMPALALTRTAPPAETKPTLAGPPAAAAPLLQFQAGGHALGVSPDKRVVSNDDTPYSGGNLTNAGLPTGGFAGLDAAGAATPEEPDSDASVNDDWGQMPLYFIANQGQLDDRVAYYVQGSDKTLYFASDGVTFALSDQRKMTNAPHLPGEPTMNDATMQRWIVKLDFVGAHAARPGGQAQTEAIISYFKGSPEEWRAGLPTYSQIVYRDVWNGIDLSYSGTVNQLKHEFVVQPGADPARIRLAYRGASVRVNDAGQLDVSTPAGGFQDDAPIAYQDVNGRRVPVAVSFALDEAQDAYGFRLGAYDPTLPLVIDPTMLVYCGFIGGSGDEAGIDIAVDAAGNAYVTGYTASTEADFPVTVGPDLTYNGGLYDAFVAKVKADGSGLDYAGYIGGNNYDYGIGIAADAAGNAYVAGYTNSTAATFPVTVGPDLTYNLGSYDAFVAKVKADGSGLDYAGYIGGSRDDYGFGIAADAAGNAYVTGRTNSTAATFPETVGPDLTQNGPAFEDAFVAKVKADGSGLDYAGYIGGAVTNSGYGIAVDAAGNAYVAGYTKSNEFSFPGGDGFGALTGPDLTHNGGTYDAFVAKVKADGSGLDYAGYIGGNNYDYGIGIAADAAGNAYVAGYTDSTAATFPDGDGFGALTGPDLTHNGSTDAFVAKVNSSGNALVYAGYIGGSGYDYGNGIAVGPGGNAYVAGQTTSTEADFPVTVGPDLTYNGGLYDAFVANVNASGAALVYAGYIGGSGEDSGYGIAVDAAGNAYVTGGTASTEATFPVTGGPDLTYNGGSYDAFVVKLESLLLTKAVSPASAKPGQAITYTIAFSNTGAITATNVVITDSLPVSVTNASVISSGVAITQTAAGYVWQTADFAPGGGGVITITGVLSQPLAAGVFTNTVTLAVSGSVKTASALLTVTNTAPVAHVGIPQTVHVGAAVSLDGSASSDPDGDTPLTYGWTQTGGSPTVTLSDPAAQSPTFTAPSTATVLTFTLTVTDSLGLASTPDETVVNVEGLVYYLPIMFKNATVP